MRVLVGHDGSRTVANAHLPVKECDRLWDHANKQAAAFLAEEKRVAHTAAAKLEIVR